MSTFRVRLPSLAAPVDRRTTNYRAGYRDGIEEGQRMQEEIDRTRIFDALRRNEGVEKELAQLRAKVAALEAAAKVSTDS